VKVREGLVADFSQLEGSTLFEHHSVRRFEGATELRASCSDAILRLPSYTPPGFRPLGWYSIQSMPGRTAYALEAYVERDFHEQPLEPERPRPLGPDNAAISVWWNRVTGVPSAYPRTALLPSEA
jgi:hypothetical protein